MKQLKDIFLHFDDELGILRAVGAGLFGAGLFAFLSDPGGGILSSESLTTLTGLVLIVLDYFK
jgi:hypothetical protein